MKKIIMSALALLMATLSFAQMPSDYMKKTEKALRVGDQMPFYTFPSIIRYPKKSFDLHEFKGKFIILDFWSVFCGSCIAAFPEIQRLQDKFKDQIQIIAVNSYWGDTPEKINKTLARFEKATGCRMSIPFTLFDSTLYSYFPHKALGLKVIIDPKGKIIAITGSDQLTEANIKAILVGKKVDFRLQDDFWNHNVPLVAYLNRNNLEGALYSSSLILMKNKKLPGSPGEGLIYDDKDQLVGRRYFYHLIGAYQEIYPTLFRGDPMISYKITDPSLDGNTQFMYEYITQARHLDQRKEDNNTYIDSLYHKTLQENLDLSFNLSLRRVKKIYPCLIVRTNEKIAKSYTVSTNPNEWDTNIGTYQMATEKHIPVYMHNWDIRTITTSLNGFFNMKAAQVVIESNVKQNLDIDFPAGFDFKNKEKLVAFLHEKGIDLTIENRVLDCVIVSDKKPGEPTVL